MSEMFDLNLIGGVYNKFGNEIECIYNNRNEIIWGTRYINRDISDDNRIYPDKIYETNYYDLRTCLRGDNTIEIISNSDYSNNIDFTNLYTIQIDGLYLGVVNDEPVLLKNNNKYINSRIYWIVDDNKLKSYHNNKYLAFKIPYIHKTQFKEEVYYGNFLIMQNTKIYGADIYFNNASLSFYKQNGIVTINSTGVIGVDYVIKDIDVYHVIVGWQWCPSYGRLYTYGPLTQEDKYVCQLDKYNTSFNVKFNKL